MTYVQLADETGLLAQGMAWTLADADAGTIDQWLRLDEDGIRRIWYARVARAGGGLTFWGSLVTLTGPPPNQVAVTLNGGWTFSALDGLQLHPDCDPGFAEAVAEMLHVPAVAGRAFNLGWIISPILNVIILPINYLRDIFIPYDPPTTCSGPIYSDADGQSCNGVNIPCKNSVNDICEDFLGSLPGVSLGFKKCMKGRCGCGGSSFQRVRVSCDAPDACGPCGETPGPGETGGCSQYGSQVWYCDPRPQSCPCINTMFHEMSHGCGSLDLKNGDVYDSYRIGDWFQEQCLSHPVR